ncbi:hypothetical protein C3747_35g146 [Trypanosoma cruzi]|uniref:Uncharacterized protein n=2 Tax=Trypanosoma cruzi TaxID=5693 RepID=Q4DLL8_TRYCC|nr:hypothetical protein, conserved [Trypanosoma cruzi]EAN93425.1 hypothetical protein, conserved [Trypanosoma cruzi]PWV14592.1 hypothetical protein C3747_35g146 [Trypanosoma cruzi]RNC45768.1 hypothetical protein TcCL_NonESM04486 [Trypanosoma cruzi]|eukprot:XP_815276.1 hypothetical protein [Trypanosoma cruzi strain CL Brener]
MGIFSKKRHGEMLATDDEGRCFTWRLENFSSFKLGTTLDGMNVVAFTKAKFHLHMTIDTNGNIGLYLHYKATGIPKYSYYFSNSKGEIMRRHTAHTIPYNTERCGHWNTCYRPDILEFIGGDDVLFVNFCFDNDSLALLRVSPKNLVVTWTVPHLFRQVLNPYSSNGFVHEGVLIGLRLEIKKEAGANDAFAPYDVRKIKDLVFFLFSRKRDVPPHSIELLDSRGMSIAKLDRKETPGVQTLTVSKEVLWDALGDDGDLQVRVEIICRGNPIDALNALSGSQLQQQQQQQQSELREGGQAGPPRTVQIGDKKEEYVVFHGDD